MEVDHGYISPCLDWLGPKAEGGYGRWRIGPDSKVPAHRISYEKKNGPIGQGMELDHLCRNPSCVNPDHLEPVTHRENVRRGKSAKLTGDQVAEIRSRYTGERGEQSSLAREYGVSFSTIHYIVHGKAWV
jgi:hypothetical protein